MNPFYDLFAVRARAVSAEVHRFATRREALDFVLEFCRADPLVCGRPPGRPRPHTTDASTAEPGRVPQTRASAPQDTTSAVWSNSRFLTAADRDDLTRQFPNLTFHVTRESAASATVGITEVEWAISETGTLVTDAAAVERRLASTLPEIHIAIVPTSGIEPDMAAVFTRIHPRQSGYISMITGPSRTADIERVLTIGVHGPKRLIIVFVDEWETQS